MGVTVFNGFSLMQGYYWLMAFFIVPLVISLYFKYREIVANGCWFRFFYQGKLKWYKINSKTIWVMFGFIKPVMKMVRNLKSTDIRQNCLET